MTKLTLLFLLSTTLAVNISQAQTVRVDNGWYYIDGHKFFVKGIGYETKARPGHVPWVYVFDAAAITHDLGMIKSAGFNTIRTWAELSEEELQLVERSGLKMLFGIWIDNGAAYGDPSFKASTLSRVSEVLNYTRKYPCIIGYLIMNEPQVEQVYTGGAQNLRDLWQAVTDTIHQKHPGIPVSFSNTMIGDYISPALFDFAAYNAYIYNPVTTIAAPGYTGMLRFLKNNRAAAKPMIVTEFGLSVSPGTPSAQYQYGANTLAQQAEGDLAMYRSLIDAGAQGCAVFQYHDGWWKGGNEWVHDPVPEEWFGLIGFADLNDKDGSPRPAWGAFASYNRAIVTEPKNEAIYNGQVPLEIFASDTVRSFSVSVNDNTLLTRALDSNYYAGVLTLKMIEPVKDVPLSFHFFDAAGAEVKTETISILYSRLMLKLPTVALQALPATLDAGGRQTVSVAVACDTTFTIEGSKVDYVAHPHIGFDNGTARSRTIALTGGAASFSDSFDIPAGSRVTTFSAAMTVRRGTFVKRFSSQQIMTSGTWADPIKATDTLVHIDKAGTEGGREAVARAIGLEQNYPNPFNPSTRIEYRIPERAHVRLEVVDMLGRTVFVLVDEEQSAGSRAVQWNASDMASGMYFCRLVAGAYVHVMKMVLMK